VIYLQKQEYNKAYVDLKPKLLIFVRGTL